MKRVIPLFVAIVLLAGCASMNVQDRDLACSINDIIAESCNLGIQKSVEVCAIARKLQAKCIPEESKAKLFKQLKEAMEKN